MSLTKHFLILGFGAVVFLSFFLTPDALFAEDVEISTYYPSPYGNYKQVQVQGLNGTLIRFTQGLARAGLNILTDYPNGGANTYTPGIFWSTQNNNSTLPKAGIWIFEDTVAGTGSKLFLGTSNNYDIGITNTYGDAAPNNGLVLDEDGQVGVGTRTPVALLDVNGAGAHGLGTVAAPSFTFRTDLDTGVWSSGAGTLNFSTAGAERVRIDTSGNVGIGTTAPDTSAILELNSTAKGFLPPRMTTAQRDAMTTPAIPALAGGVIYNTTTKQLNVYDGSAWKVVGVASPHVVMVGSYAGDATALKTISLGFRTSRVELFYSNVLWEKIDGMPQNQSLAINNNQGQQGKTCQMVYSSLNITDDGFTVGMFTSVPNFETNDSWRLFSYMAYP